MQQGSQALLPPRDLSFSSGLRTSWSRSKDILGDTDNILARLSRLGTDGDKDDYSILEDNENSLGGPRPYQSKVSLCLIHLYARGEEVLRLAHWGGGGRRDRL
jgi:hypothetical protein